MIRRAKAFMLDFLFRGPELNGMARMSKIYESSEDAAE